MEDIENPLKEIKHLFFTYRNGALAETLRKYGDPHKIIFGLDVPQIASIARGFSPSFELADRLWKDRDVRESRLLASYLFPVDEIKKEKAKEICGDIRNQEEADMLSFRLLKRLPYAQALLEEFKSESSRTNNESISMAHQALKQHLA